MPRSRVTVAPDRTSIIHLDLHFFRAFPSLAIHPSPPFSYVREKSRASFFFFLSPCIRFFPRPMSKIQVCQVSWAYSYIAPELRLFPTIGRPRAFLLAAISLSLFPPSLPPIPLLLPSPQQLVAILTLQVEPGVEIASPFPSLSFFAFCGFCGGLDIYRERGRFSLSLSLLVYGSSFLTKQVI